ncbi:DUF2264 domain-containing protein [Adhaeribacter pallidiroseus]|uniref:DUF2264 domain-containing protein n=1 Tax=Adhaeribacter pallidiroseus TaxID=2072847 RepID=A0A369QPV6_9BACT|nr:DUF2264 domain-containing protein [Adhaeribacter pallidiroseus]RDC65277.1 hypothetical protein AHMF7616_03907 [Adhaeribacter pallidiroseus]
MFRRDFLKNSFLAGVSTSVLSPSLAATVRKPELNDRAYWIQTLTRIADPVLTNLSQGKLKATMPVESTKGQDKERPKYTHLEAFGRLLAGMAPWLELGAENSPEGKTRQKYLDLAQQSLAMAVDPKSPDFLNFNQGGQPVVDAAFLSHALIRAPKQLRDKIAPETRTHLIKALQASRVIKPYYSNWLLFSAMVEMALLSLGEPWDAMRVDYALREHQNWYKGDGIYGDGPEFHYDYYNSYVIHPMLVDITKTLRDHDPQYEELHQTILRRAQRYAAIQERLISPEGTFPPVGRSLAYRFGAFQALAQIAYMQKLSEGIKPAQVRSALTAVIKKTMAAPNTFDKNGWLQIGFCGHQPSIGETYISTGSLYLCTTGLLPLGLPATNEFWTGPAQDWTAKKAWSGQDLPTDHAI